MQEEAFYVLDVGDIISKHNQWKRKLPRVEPHYGKNAHFLALIAILTPDVLFISAVKCNDSQMVLEVLTSLGTSFDCASKVIFLPRQFLNAKLIAG
jgi:ornithine decarboxylase